MININFLNNCDHFLNIRGNYSNVKNPIIIVNLDNNSIKGLKLSFPFNRKVYADVIKHIAADNPKVIGVDFLFTEKSTTKDDEYFRKTIKNISTSLVLANSFYLTDKAEHIKGESFQMHSLGIENPIFNSSYGFVNIIKDSDEVLRKTQLKIDIQKKTLKSFSLVLAEKYLSKTIENIQKKEVINYYSPLPYFKQMSFYEVYKKLFPKNTFKNKIVIIAPGFVASKDFYKTPFNKKVMGAEIFAHSTLNLIHNQFITSSSFLIKSVFLALLFLMINFIFQLKINFKKLIIINLSLLVGFYFIFIGLFILFQLFIPLLLIFFTTLLSLSLMALKFIIYFFKLKETLSLLKLSSQDKTTHFFDNYQITPREQEIILLLKEGLKNHQIAKKLFISPNTVKFHINNIYKKTKTKTRLELFNLIEQTG